ncbi:MAG TPA: DUF1015 domain-containing protein [Candidatus Dormibacteraeota bacterium]|nr:DUF1015 domain-containing protein [Candidatus Dormibacteraeota bacterium]
MATVRPFQGIMYDPRRVDLGKVVAPPYDVISPDDRQRYYEQDPHNVVRLISGEVRPTDTAEDNKYLRAARYFSDWQREGILRRESEPAMYVYRHEFVDPTSGAARTRTGILAVVELEPFGAGILPHERTHARAKADRLSLTRAVGANLSPIFALYDDPISAVALSASSITAGRPQLALTAEDGDQHTVWSITAAQHFRDLASVLSRSRLYIADGHHRYETALNYRNKIRLEHPEAPPDAAFNYVLMLLVEVNDPGLIILPTHRIVHDLEAFDGERLMGALRARYMVRDYPDRAALLTAMQEPAAAHRIGLALITPPPSRGGSGKGLASMTIDIPKAPTSDPVSGLDVTVLHREILQRELGFEDELVEEERHLSYSRDLPAVLDRVEGGSAQAAFLLRPPAVSDVAAVAQAGQVMPQKSTYFYPKPASGIVFNPLDPGIRIPSL